MAAKKKTTPVPTFKVGDRVRILRTARTHERGWRNSWVDSMDDTIGKIGMVVAGGLGGIDVEVKVPGQHCSWGYPSFVLKRAQQKKKSVR